VLWISLLEMSEVLYIESPEKRLNYFLEVQSKNYLWIVPSLDVKSQIENFCLEKFGFFDSQSVVTKNDFWLLLFKKKFSDFYIVEFDFIKAFLKGFQLKQKEDVIFQLMNDFCTGFLNSYDEVIKDWFSANQMNSSDLLNDLTIAKTIFDSLISRKIIFKSWISEYLLLNSNKENIDKSFLDKEIFVDLGSAQTDMDVQLLECFFSKGKIKNLKPKIDLSDSNFYNNSNYFCLESTSIANEVRQALRLIRHHYSKGKKLSDIAIITANKKLYWPLLLEMGRLEGITFNEPETQSLIEIPEVSRWLSYLKIQSKSFQYAELESLGSYDGLSSHSFEKFEAENFNLLTHEYVIKFRSQFSEALSDDLLLSSQQFLQYVLATMTRFNLQDSLEYLNKIFIEVLSSPAVLMNFNQWLSFLCMKIINFNRVLTSEQKEGVFILSVHSSSYWQGTCKIYLGLDTSFGIEDKKEDSYFSTQQQVKAKSELGFAKSRIDFSLALEEYDWALKARKDGLSYFSYSTFNSQGSADSASRTWLELNEKKSKNELEQKDFNLSPLRADKLKIDFEKFKKDNTLYLESTLKKGYLTITAIEKHIRCPFVYAVEEELNFKSEISTDLRLDARTIGTIKHEILDYIVTEKIWLLRDNSKLEKSIEQIFNKHRRYFFDETSFQGELKKFLNWSLDFISFEKQWRSNFPLTETAYTEKSFDVKFNDVIFKGKIDRIDICKSGDEFKEMVVIDYKNSGSRLTGLDSWIKTHQLQLLFYTWVVENYLSKNDSKLKDLHLSGAFYFLVNNLDRSSYGLRLLQEKSLLVDLTTSERNKISKEKLDLLFADLETILGEQVRKIKLGIFKAEPQDVRDCEVCNWRTTCRAKHLTT